MNLDTIPTVKTLKSKNILYIITTGQHHLAIYSDNTAILMPKADELPLVLTKTKKGWKHSETSKLFSSCESAIDKFLSRTTSLRKLDKDQAAEMAESLGMPKKQRYKADAFVSGTEDDIIGVMWDKRNRTWYRAGEYTNILEFFTVSNYDADTILYVDQIHQMSQFERLKSFLEQHKDFDIISVDTETFDPEEPGGWRALSHRHGQVRSLQLWFPKTDKGAFIDFGMRGSNLYSAALSKYLEEYFTGKRLVFHNAVFDLSMLEAQLGIKVNSSTIIDTQVLSQNHWAGLRIMPHSLGAVADRLGLEINKDMQTSDFGVPLIPAQIQYGMDDTKVTAQVMQRMVKLLQTNCGNIAPAKIDCDFILPLHQMRMKGFPVNQDKLAESIEQMELWLQKRAEEFLLVAGCKYTEREKVLEALQTLYPEEKIVSTNKTEMARRSHLPVVKLLTDCKFVAIRLAYLYAVRDAVTPDGTVCGGFRPLANQGMGRTACTAKVGGKNGVFVQLQNPAKPDKRYPELPDLRKIFHGGRNEKRGVNRKLIIADLSSCHLRLSHVFSDETSQIELCNTPGADSHSYNAAIVVKTALMSGNDYHHLCTYEDFLEAKNKEDKDAKRIRDLSKNAIYTKINFGTAWSLQSTIQKFGENIDIETCELVMEGIGEAIPRWTDYCKTKLKEANGFSYDFSYLYKDLEDIRQAFIDDGVDDEDELEVLMDEVKRKRPTSFGYLIAPTGRGRYVPKYTRQSRYGNNTYETAKINDISAHIVQSPEADIMKRAGRRFYNWTKEHIPEGVDCWLAVIAHDEIVVVVDEDYADKAGQALWTFMDAESRKVAPSLPLLEPWSYTGYVKNNWSEK